MRESAVGGSNGNSELLRNVYSLWQTGHQGVGLLTRATRGFPDRYSSGLDPRHSIQPQDKEPRLRPSSNTSEYNGLALAVGGALSLMSVFLALTAVGASTWVPYVCLVFGALPAGVLVQ